MSKTRTASGAIGPFPLLRNLFVRWHNELRYTKYQNPILGTVHLKKFMEPEMIRGQVKLVGSPRVGYRHPFIFC